MKNSRAVLVALFTLLFASPASAQDDANMTPAADDDVDGLSFGDMEDPSALLR